MMRTELLATNNFITSAFSQFMNLYGRKIMGFCTKRITNYDEENTVYEKKESTGAVRSRNRVKTQMTDGKLSANVCQSVCTGDRTPDTSDQPKQ